MTAIPEPATGLELANPLPSSTMTEASRRLESSVSAGQAARDEDPLSQPCQPKHLLDAWRPSERRRLGVLSTRSYDNAAMCVPTDVWSYQRLFIEQRRDAANPFAAKHGSR